MEANYAQGAKSAVNGVGKSSVLPYYPMPVFGSWSDTGLNLQPQLAWNRKSKAVKLEFHGTDTDFKDAPSCNFVNVTVHAYICTRAHLYRQPHEDSREETRVSD